MADARRATTDALKAAVAAGKATAIKAAAVEYLNAAQAAGAPWADERATRFRALPLNSDDWGAIMLAGRGATEGPRLWARHSAAYGSSEEVTRSEYLDLLHCRLVAGDLSPLPPTPDKEYHEPVSAEELGTYQALIAGIERRDPVQVEYSLKQLQRYYDIGPIFVAGIRAVARKCGVDFPA